MERGRGVRGARLSEMNRGNLIGLRRQRLGSERGCASKRKKIPVLAWFCVSWLSRRSQNKEEESKHRQEGGQRGSHAL